MESGGLINIRSIKSDMHCHSKEGSPRDAIFEVTELVRFYRNVLGLNRVVLTNHCWDSDPSWLPKTKQAVDVARELFPDMDIWNGQELNINGDGSVNLPFDIDLSDFNIASIHQRPFPPSVDVTERLLMAIENPFIDVIGHPGVGFSDYVYGIDWTAITAKARKYNKAIEINICELLSFIDDPLIRGNIGERIYILKDHIISAFVDSETPISIGSDLHTYSRVSTLKPLGWDFRKLAELINLFKSKGIRQSQVINTFESYQLRMWVNGHRSS